MVGSGEDESPTTASSDAGRAPADELGAYRAILDALDDAVFFADPDGRVVKANAAACRQLGYGPEELVGLSVGAITGRKDFDFPAMRERLERAGRLAYESFHVRKDGTLVPVHLSLTSIPDLGEWRMVGIARDLTEERRVRAQADEQGRLIQGIADTTPGILYVFDTVLQRCVYANKQLSSVLGYPEAEARALADQLFQPILHPEDLARVPENMAKFALAKEGEVLEFEYRIRSGDGSWKWLHSWDTVLSRSEAGVPLKIHGFAIDITDRKQSEEAMRTTSQRLALATASARIGIWDWDVDSDTLVWDARTHDRHGVTPENFARRAR